MIKNIERGFTVSISEKIRLLLRRRGVTITALAERIGLSRSRLMVKLKENNFSVSDLQKIAAALGCSFEGCFVMLDTEEKI